MLYLLQDNYLHGMNLEKLIASLDELDIPYIGVGVIPFTDTITNFPENTFQSMRVFGTTRLVEIVASRADIQPGVDYEPGWFDPRLPDQHGMKTLSNDNYRVFTMGILRREWIDEAVFVKPFNVKAIVGQVIEVDGKEDFLKEWAHVPDEELLVRCEPVRIKSEWRFFIVDGNIVTGSSYRHEGVRRIMMPVSNEVYKAAEQLASTYLPNPNIVMDMALTEDGEYRLVEFNAVNSSGFYNCDTTKIVKALEDIR